MPKLCKDLPGAEPVDRSGALVGPPVTLPAGTEFVVTVPKLKRSEDSFDVCWCEIQVDGRL